MTERIDCVVIGAGVIGLAVARALALVGREVVVLEAADMIGSVTSSRNSEVIHAGIYYPAGSLKARLCRQGRDRLYAFCASHGVEHSRLGKLIVATREEQRDRLRAIAAAAQANGVEDLVWLERAEAQAREPALACVAALWSPSTGIVDSHGLMLALQADAEAAGAMVAFESPVIGGEVTDGGCVLEVGGREPLRLAAGLVVNAAGLGAQRLCQALSGFPSQQIPPLHMAKGSYFSLSGRTPFRHLIYPIPVDGGLGVHLTLDLAGRGRFGPDVEWVTEENYDVDPRRADSFYAEIRTYWPDLPDAALTPSYSGIRPKLSGRGQPAADFLCQGPAEHGVPGLINLFGIESPGLTSCLALADLVVAKAAR